MLRARSLGVALLLAATLAADRADAQQQLRALGIDISAWQGNLSTTNWATLHRPTNQQVNGVFGDGRDFVFIRSSRGGTTGFYNQSDPENKSNLNTLSQRYDDPYFVQNITRATNAGMLAGPYHFGRMDIVAETQNANGIANTGADEADHFIQMAGPWMRPGYLVPVFDLEAGISQRTGAELAQFAIDFSNRIYEVMGIRPAVYIGGNYAQEIQNESSTSLEQELVAAYPTLWSARWPNQANPNSIPIQTAHPKDTFTPIYGPWDDAGVTHPWSFWQYASTARLNGYSSGTSNIDVDVAQGGIEFLKDKLVPAVWTAAGDGLWTTMTNWNSGQTPVAPVQGPGQAARVGTMVLPTARLPGANDTVVLDKSNASVAIMLDSGDHTIRKLYVRETLSINGGSLTINYTPSWDSTTFAAQFSAPVAISGGAQLRVHTLQVDAQRNFTAGGGATLAFSAINLMPHASSPAKMILNGNVNFESVAGAPATIANGAGSGSSGRIDLAGGNRKLTVADGAAEIDLTISTPIVNGGLTKAGAGALALTGANSYAGDTTVRAGLLRIGGPWLADEADLYLSTGALLDLAFSGAADVIDSLFVDGVSQPAGLWGAEGSGAEHTSPLLMGMGLLQVTRFVAPPIPGDFNGDGFVDGLDLADWQSGLGMETCAATTDGDADADGDVDGADFLTWQRQLGADPGSPAAASVPEPSAALLAACLAAMLLLAALRDRAAA